MSADMRRARIIHEINELLNSPTTQRNISEAQNQFNFPVKKRHDTCAAVFRYLLVFILGIVVAYIFPFDEALEYTKPACNGAEQLFQWIIMNVQFYWCQFMIIGCDVLNVLTKVIFEYFE